MMLEVGARVWTVESRMWVETGWVGRVHVHACASGRGREVSGCS